MPENLTEIRLRANRGVASYDGVCAGLLDSVVFQWFVEACQEWIQVQPFEPICLSVKALGLLI